MDLPSYIRSLAPDVPGAIEKAAVLFNARPGAVKAWLYGERFPRREKATEIVERTKGKVDFDGIYGSQGRPQ